MLFLAEEPPVDIQPVLVDQGLLRARGDPGGGGHGGHSDHGGGQPWPRGDTKEGDKPWVGGDFGPWINDPLSIDRNCTGKFFLNKKSSQHS